MESIRQRYFTALQKAQETVAILEAELNEIRYKLQQHPTHSGYLNELKKATLDMTITLNELEHCQSKIDEFRAGQRAMEEYND